MKLRSFALIVICISVCAGGFFYFYRQSHIANYEECVSEIVSEADSKFSYAVLSGHCSGKFKNDNRFLDKKHSDKYFQCVFEHGPNAKTDYGLAGTLAMCEEEYD